jgi:hypothetical protein
MKMEAICSSETSVGFKGTTRHYVQEKSTIQYWASGWEVYRAFCGCESVKVKIKLSLQQAVEAYWDVKRREFHIF